MPVYQIRDWQKHFENSRTRELTKMQWIPIPNKQDGDGFRAVISAENGVEMFGAWVLILEIASKCEPRGTLVRGNGKPHTPETIARICGAKTDVIQKALELLCSDDVGWIEVQNESASGGFNPASGGFNPASGGFNPASTRIESQPATLQCDSVLDGDVSGHAQKQAHQRVRRHLRADRGVHTPDGIVKTRPKCCQWCKVKAENVGRDQPGIVAHHPFGYGTFPRDLSVVFVCRKCHGFFESERSDHTTEAIIKRYGIEWLEPELNRIVSQDAAIQCLWNGMEEKGREKKKISTAVSPPYQEIADAWNQHFGQRCRLTEKRRAAIKSRWTDEWWRANWLAAIQRGAACSFLRGGGRDGWTADLEFFLRPDTATKILEGKYDDRAGQNTAARREQDQFQTISDWASGVREGDGDAVCIETHGRVVDDNADGVARSPPALPANDA